MGKIVNKVLEYNKYQAHKNTSRNVISEQ